MARHITEFFTFEFGSSISANVNIALLPILGSNKSVRARFEQASPGKWSCSTTCPVHIGNSRIEVPIFTVASTIVSSHLPESHSAQSIKDFMRKHWQPGFALVSYVADYNFTPHLFIMGVDKSVSMTRVTDYNWECVHVS